MSASTPTSQTPSFVNYGARAPSPYNDSTIAQRQFQLGGIPIGTNMFGQPMYSQTGYNMTYTQRPPIQQQQYIRPAQTQQQPSNNAYFGMSPPSHFVSPFFSYGYQSPYLVSPYQNNWYGGPLGEGQGGE